MYYRVFCLAVVAMSVDFQTAQNIGDFSLVKIFLETGRMRVQLNFINPA